MKLKNLIIDLLNNYDIEAEFDYLLYKEENCKIKIDSAIAIPTSTLEINFLGDNKNECQRPT